MNRRKFIASSGRSLLASLMGLFTGYLILKGKISAPASCRENAFCQQCLKFGACTQAQALHTQSSLQSSGKETQIQTHGKK
jgi:hypothetical protein